MINFEKIKLSNGLRIITAPMKETKAVTILLLIGTGSRYEEKKLNGISHFLEHLFFKGTKRRPSSLEITQELDGVGASYNAFTADEETGFYIRVPADHFSLGLDVLMDILFNSKFDPEEIEREKGVILEEINMYQDIPQRYVFDLTKQLFYGNTTLGRPTVGIKKTIKKFQRDDFIQYRENFYNPNNMIIAVAGNKTTDWQKAIKNYLAEYPFKKKINYQKVESKQKSPRVLFHYKPTDQAHLTLGFPTFPRTDKRRPVLKILNNLLGETMSSRLFTQVRERRGLAYYIGTDFWDFHDNGAILAHAGIDLQRIEESIKVILEEFAKMKNKKVKQSELDKAKENLKGRMYLGLEDSVSVASFLADQELFWNKIETPEQIIHKVFKVNIDDIMKLANHLFVPEKLNLTMISPFKNKEKLQKLFKI